MHLPAVSIYRNIFAFLFFVSFLEFCYLIVVYNPSKNEENAEVKTNCPWFSCPIREIIIPVVEKYNRFLDCLCVS